MRSKLKAWLAARFFRLTLPPRLAGWWRGPLVVPDKNPTYTKGKDKRQTRGREFWKLYRHSPGPVGASVLRPRTMRQRRRIRRFLVVCSLSALVAFIPLWILRMTGFAEPTTYLLHQMLTLTAPLGLAVDQITVDGRNRTTIADILAVLQAPRGTPILRVDAQAARIRLEALPWIRSAMVERRLPDKLHIEIQERRPLVLWQLDGKITLIDELGEPIPVNDFLPYRHLLLVVGPGAADHAAGLVAMLETEQALARRVTAAIRVGQRRWHLHLDGGRGKDGIDLHLPEQDAQSAWAHLAALDRDEDVLARAIVEIDMRIKDRLVLRQKTSDTIVIEPKAQQATRP